MTPEQFTYWLQGWFELNKTIDHRAGATPETLKVIEDHLQLVFTKVTPDRSDKVAIDFTKILKDYDRDSDKPLLPFKWESIPPEYC